MNRYGSDRSQNRHGPSSTICLVRKKISDTSGHVCSLMTTAEKFYSKFRFQLFQEIHVDRTDGRLGCSRSRSWDSWHPRVLMDYLKWNLAPRDHPNTPIMFTDTLLTGFLRRESGNFKLSDFAPLSWERVYKRLPGIKRIVCTLLDSFQWSDTDLVDNIIIMHHASIILCPHYESAWDHPVRSWIPMVHLHLSVSPIAQIEESDLDQSMAW